MDLTPLKDASVAVYNKAGSVLTTAVRLPLIVVAETADFCSKAVMIAGEFVGAAAAIDGATYLAGIRTELPSGHSVSYGTRLFAVYNLGDRYSQQSYSVPDREQLGNLALVELVGGAAIMGVGAPIASLAFRKISTLARELERQL